MTTSSSISTSRPVELLIAGQSVLSPTTFTVLSSHSQLPVGTSSHATLAHVDAALESAAASFESWEAVSVGKKREIFLRAAEVLESPEWSDKIRVAMREEISAAPGWIEVNIAASAAALRETAGLGNRVREGSYMESTTPGCQFLVQRRAVGVVVGIAPWNAPIILALRAIAIPLFAGNTVILKGSEYTPASQRILIDIFLLAGLPPTALQFLLFTRETAGELTERLIVHKAVKRVTFTGSDKVGRIVGGICGREIKQCVLELGGKAPAVVLEDANLEEAANGIVSGSMLHSGQICMSTERVIVHSSVHDKLVSLITSRVALLSSGDLHPTGPSTSQLSALFSITAAENVNRMLEAGKKAGLAWAYDGGESQGTVVQPHVILVSPEERTTSELWKEEVFGPVICISPVSSTEEAIAVANDSDYSLIASLWTTSLSSLPIAQRIRAGSVQINGTTIHIEPAFGNAGLGGKSGYGRFNLDSFTDMRSIGIHMPGKKFPLVQ